MARRVLLGGKVSIIHFTDANKRRKALKRNRKVKIDYCVERSKGDLEKQGKSSSVKAKLGLLVLERAFAYDLARKTREQKKVRKIRKMLKEEDRR